MFTGPAVFCALGARQTCVTLTVVIMLACSPDSGLERRRIVADSAGIQIVTNTEPEWDSASAWSVDSRPSVAIGVSQGAPEYELSNVSGVTRLRSGNIVVLDGGSQQLRIFDSRGKFLASVAGRGRGPGEFVSAVSLFRYRSDSVFVYDPIGGRVSIFDHSLNLGRSISTAQLGSVRYWWEGPVEDSLFILYSSSGPAPRGPDLSWDSTYVVLVEPSGSRADTLGGRRWPLGEGSRGHEVYFAAGAYFAPSALGFFWGTSDRPVIGEYSPNGTLVRSIRRVWQPTKVTDSMILAYESRRLEKPEGQVKVLHPEYLPVFSALRSDTIGNLWVRRYDPEHELQTMPDWDVFGIEGEWLGVVRMPPGLRIVEIGSDYVLGLVTDTLGVQSVRLHRLHKQR